MLNFIVFDDQIKVWWEYRRLTKKQQYSVYFNGEKIADTTATNYSFKNLQADTSYKIKVQIESENQTKLVGEQEIKTLIKKNVIDITKFPYNAIGDGKTLNTSAIQTAINDCTENDCVYIPSGKYITGALFLHSDMELRLADDAILQGSESYADYLPKIHSRFEGTEDECYASLINTGVLNHKEGYNCKNIIVRGGSILGGGQALRLSIIENERIELQKQLRSEGAPEEEVTSWRNTYIIPGLKRGRLMQISNTQNFILADCTCGMAPAWNLHFIYSDNITTCGCKVISKDISNGDGWDPDSSTNCICFDTFFDTGDDCVAIKSGKNPEGNAINRPTEHVKVFDCSSAGGHGICVGSEMSGGVNDVQFWNCDAYNTFSGIYLKAPTQRGGYITNFSVRNCRTSKIKVEQIYYAMNVGSKDALKPSFISNILYEDIELNGLDIYWDERREKCYAISLLGSDYEGYGITNVTLRNIKMNHRALIPNQVLFFKNAKNVTIENIFAE